MRFSTILLAFIEATFLLSGVVSWPHVPLKTSGRWIQDSTGNVLTYAGVNWPGAADTMIPEGLQYQSIETIVGMIKSLGMNVIRLTFAIEMIDDIYNGGDVTLETSFNNVLGSSGASVYNDVLSNNPSFNSSTTRLQVFDAIAKECLKQGIYVHLDNHISKAMWCCSETDGNAWFGDTYFNVGNWKRGLEYMVTRGASWGNLISIGMRNELRTPADNSTLEADSYGWKDWYSNMVAAADIINAANPDILIFFSGLNYDTDDSPLPLASSLGGGEVFDKSSFAYKDKIVLELHNYETGTSDCSSFQQELYGYGFDALDRANTSIKNILPVVMTEWGFEQDSSGYSSTYVTCLASYLPSHHAGWMIWVIAGSYYIRSGTLDYDETWGLLSHDWSDWRYSSGVTGVLQPMISSCLATATSVAPSTSALASTSTGTRALTTASTFATVTTSIVSTSRSTTSVASSTTSAASTTVAQWGQCGGREWTGSTICVAGTTCIVWNPYFSQCL